jgi:PAS domain S-box-containing protein
MGKLKPSYKALEIEVEQLEKELQLARKSAERLLQQENRSFEKNESLNRPIMDTMLEGCQVIGFDWRYTYINNSASLHNKRDASELLGNRYFDMWPGIENTQLYSLIKDCLENRNSHQLENKFEFPDKSIGWFKLSIQPVPEGVFILSIDITEQKRIEDILLKNQELLEEMGSIAKIGGWEFDPETGEGTWTDEVARIHDLEPGKKTNVQLGLSFYSGNSRQKIEEAIQQAIKNHKPYSLELELNTKTRKKWVRTLGKPVLEKGKVVKIRGSFQDITDKKLIEQELQNSKAMFSAIFKQSPIAASLLKRENLSYVEVNDSWCKALSFSSDEVIGKTAVELDIIPVETLDEINLEFLENKSVSNFETIIKTKTGEERYVLVSSEVLSFGGEKYVLNHFIDVTERIHVEVERNKTMNFLDTVIEQSPFAIWVSDRDGTAIRTNQTLRRLLNLTDEDIIGQYNIFQDHNLHEQGVMPLINSVFKQKKTVRFVVYWDPQKIEKNGFSKGNTLWIDISIFAILNVNGEIDCVVYQWLDITELKNSEKALKRSEKRLNEAQYIANIGDFTWVVETGDVTWSESLYKMLGYTKEEIIDYAKVNEEIHHPDDLERVTDWLKTCLNSGTGKLTPNEYRLLRKDKKMLYVRTIGVIEKNQNNNTVVFATIQDITEKKLTEININKLNQELEQRVIERTNQLEKINKELRTFTYSVSHDLKAPLRGIDGYSRLLQESYNQDLNEEARFFIKNIREASEQMNQLIEDLLIYAKLEKSSLCKIEINIKTFVKNLLKLYKTEIDRNNIKVNLDFDECIIHTDQNSFALVLRNVIENSIKFTGKIESPEITVGILKEKATKTLFIKDNGIGFDMKYHDKIFDIFQRLHRIEEYPGTGIGLALVGKAMEKIGGSIWAESQPGKGATFYLKLPET